jgi:hypothetical protein
MFGQNLIIDFDEIIVYTVQKRSGLSRFPHAVGAVQEVLI